MCRSADRPPSRRRNFDFPGRRDVLSPVSVIRAGCASSESVLTSRTRLIWTAAVHRCRTRFLERSFVLALSCFTTLRQQHVQQAPRQRIYLTGLAWIADRPDQRTQCLRSQCTQHLPAHTFLKESSVMKLDACVIGFHDKTGQRAYDLKPACPAASQCSSRPSSCRRRNAKSSPHLSGGFGPMSAGQSCRRTSELAGAVARALQSNPFQRRRLNLSTPKN